MSGARAPMTVPAAVPASSVLAAAGARPNRWPAASAISARRAMPATAQGSALLIPNCLERASTSSPAAVPQR